MPFWDVTGPVLILLRVQGCSAAVLCSCLEMPANQSAQRSVSLHQNDTQSDSHGKGQRCTLSVTDECNHDPSQPFTSLLECCEQWYGSAQPSHFQGEPEDTFTAQHRLVCANIWTCASEINWCVQQFFFFGKKRNLVSWHTPWFLHPYQTDHHHCLSFPLELRVAQALQLPNARLLRLGLMHALSTFRRRVFFT